MSGVMKCFLPTATIRMSAAPVTLGKSFVFEWHTVTVALCVIIRLAAGLPTMLLRPITTQFAPIKLIFSRRKSSTQPAGVQGASPSFPMLVSPAL
jgi:hypothetical protein